MKDNPLSLLGRFRSGRSVTRVLLSEITFDPCHPRKNMDDASLDALAESIRRYGLLTPVLLHPSGTGYELIAGERRIRALIRLQIDSVDAVILPDGGQDTALLSLIENLHREPLSYFDEAEAYRAWMERHHLSQEALAARLLKSPSAVANKLRLLRLPVSVRAELQKNALSERHARTLLRLHSEERQLMAARQAARNRLSVRQTEALVSRMLTEPLKAPHVRALCRDHRLFINAMLDTVRTIQRSNAAVVSQVVEREEDVQVIVTIPLARSIRKADAPHDIGRNPAVGDIHLLS